MSETPLRAALHLPSLSVTGFRGIPHLEVERLGRVTLLAGENGVGKTTLLDAVRLYAAQGNYSTIRRTLLDNDEVIIVSDDNDNAIAIPDFESLFYGRQPTLESCIAITPGQQEPSLHIRPGMGLFQRHWTAYADSPEGLDTLLEVYLPGLEGKVKMNFRSERNPIIYRAQVSEKIEDSSEISCQKLGPDVLNNSDVAAFWSSVALTAGETRALYALRLIYGDTIERVAAVDDAAANPRSGRRMLVKVKGLGDRVPLRSLGDGALRMYSVALALSSSPGSVLLIDEAENGIHHSVQADFWKMVLQTAQENNIQVIATTHSWDCVVGFARAVRDLDEMDGAFVRLEKTDAAMRAVSYSRQNLIAAAKHGIETR